MSGTELAALIAAIAFLGLVVVIAYFILNLNKNISRSLTQVESILVKADESVEMLNKDVDILLKQVEGLLTVGNELVTDVTHKVETIDPLFQAVADLSETVSELNESSKSLAIKMSGVGKSATKTAVISKTAKTAMNLFKTGGA